MRPDQWDWSPAGDAIAVESKIDGRQTLQVAPTDGSAPPRVFDTGMEVTWPFWLPPDGDEIMFRGVAKTPEGPRSGLFAISPEGGEPRPLTATDGDRDDDYQGPIPSPDGTHVLYGVWDPVAMMETVRLLDLGTGTDEALPHTGSHSTAKGAACSQPDGSLVAFRGFEATRGPTVRRARRRERGAAGPDRDHRPGEAYAGVRPGRHEGDVQPVRQQSTLLIDVESGAAETLPDRIADPATWQRLAP